MTRALPGVTLRAAAAEDFHAVTAIYAHHVRTGTATFEIDVPDVDEMARRWREVGERGLPYLVAVGDEVLGFAYAAPYRPRPAYRYTLEDSVYIDKCARGQGIGRALLVALVDAAAQAGARQMVAVIGDAGNDASIRLHASVGFTRVGILESVGNKFGRWLDVVLMQRALGAGNGAPAE